MIYPIKFVLYGRPLVQKNNLVVYQKTIKGGKRIPFIGHSKALNEARQEASFILYNQYIEQGYNEPIDYLFSMRTVYFVTKQWEADLDNLSAFVLDALQGTKDDVVTNKVIVNDKLLRHLESEKIVKGDTNYHGEPRTEFEISRYVGKSRDGADVSIVSGSDQCSEQGTKVTF